MNDQQMCERINNVWYTLEEAKVVKKENKLKELFNTQSAYDIIESLARGKYLDEIIEIVGE